MRRLALSPDGYPVPFFVAWVDGKPDFRIVDSAKMHDCIRFGLCWLCGQSIGTWKTYVIGPMCAVNRVSSEPPSHTACAEFAVRACPFLTRPQVHRREGHKPEGLVEPAGIGVTRNPGVALLWTNRRPLHFVGVPKGLAGATNFLFDVGAPERIAWYAEGREATPEEIWASFNGGLELLRGMAVKEGPEAVVVLEQQIQQAKVFLPEGGSRRSLGPR